MYSLKADEWRKFEVARKLQRQSILQPGSIADTTHVCVCVTTYEDLTKAHGYKNLIGGSARGGGVVWGHVSFPATGESEKNNALSSRRLAHVDEKV